MDIVNFAYLEISDAEFLYEENKGNVKEYFCDFTSLEDAKKWVKESLIKTVNMEKEEWIISTNEKKIGAISLYKVGEEHHIGLWIAENMQGQGYGKKILSLFLEKIRKRGFPDVVYYVVDRKNIASIICAEVSGFEVVQRRISEIVYKFRIE